MSELLPEQLKSRMEQRGAFWLSEISTELLKESDCMQQVMVLPKDLNERFSYLANLLVQMVNNAANEANLRIVVRRLCESLAYMSNSCSWQEGTLHDFDRHEIERKLAFLISDRKELL